MKLEVLGNKKPLLLPKNFLKNFLEFLEKTLKKQEILPAASNKKLTIVFMSSKSMRSLNRKFLKKDFVTDVLSFSALEKDSFGELALCREKIESQAVAHNLSVEEETAYLILHGFLHLLGYHHEKDVEEAEKMYKIQDKIFDEWRFLKNPGKRENSL